MAASGLLRRLMDSVCRLYLVTPPALPRGFDAALAAALDAGDVAAVKLALPGAPPEEVRAAADLLRPIAQARGVAFMLAGDPALAVAAGCDGVHLAPGDVPVAQARKLIGGLQLGVSCGGSRDAAMNAGEAGADYIAFGPYLAGGDEAPDPELLPWWVELMELPAVAEGAITAANCAPLVRAGADFLAVNEAVWNDAAGPAAAVKALLAAIAAA
jgi:thiamine-phosphate pyrophosphorylase